jgi:hypothetical protein
MDRIQERFSKMTADELRREISRIEDRASRADTMEAALQDFYCLQEANAALNKFRQDQAQTLV